MLTSDIRHEVDRAWDSIWSTGVTNPIVVSDLIGTLLMAGAASETWDKLHEYAVDGTPEPIARLLSTVRRKYGLDAGSEIEAAEFWAADHSLVRTMDLIWPVIKAHGDVLGDIYEHILSRLSLAGHFGQFRTPRHIVDFMVEAIDPQNGEMVADPACGSGGFLVSTSDYRKRNGRRGSEYGIEIDRTIARIALANTVFHGMDDSTITHGDGLTQKMAVKPDVILANPPFAGAVGAEVAAKYASGSSKTELLFVEAIANALVDGGRAAVIVPSGVISGNNGAGRFLRQLLVEANTLEAVIDLPSGVFRPYTDVKTAILIWRNEASSSESRTKMIRISADGYSLDARRLPVSDNDLPAVLDLLRGKEAEVSAVDVTADTLAEFDYNLNPARYITVRGFEQADEGNPEDALELMKDSVKTILAKLARVQELI